MTEAERNGRIANVTVQAVDQIGENAAKEIDQAAAKIRYDAEELARKLEELASSLRERTIVASGMVAEFTQTMAHSMQTIINLQEKLTGKVSDNMDARQRGEEAMQRSELQHR